MIQTFEQYLLIIGIISKDFHYMPEQLTGNVKFFQFCYDNKVGERTALIKMPKNL